MLLYYCLYEVKNCGVVMLCSSTVFIPRSVKFGHLARSEFEMRDTEMER